MADKIKTAFGLTVLKKSGESKTKRVHSSFNVFGGENDEEANGKQTSCQKLSIAVKRKAQMDIDKALKEDPTVYEYDSIHDDLQATQSQVGAKEKSSEKKPRYITAFIKAAEAKKKENERRKERRVQKEREEEGEKFREKEKFVTASYKKKMLQMAEDEEREKREVAMENMLDVTKQKDLSGFYRYLLRAKTGNQVVEETKKKVN
ncbi:nuclear speckle splicing regulatory protein 1-like isoform X1 [Biomphalaria glabrata]|uniref:Nuclear speckle splicing regulatory protein 1-like isoform X1 n=1 Tax=Biomphalaria glabrata TaxID=6526 RepID=A0A9W2YK51_BIOGL|nr:nuclear speckle splicing regulatory protein 1-like isoform X1 [Biomphalaria glabrata]XP_055863159.1 nuclear speckle splicing regulatory protein 1-like isoform X1 [Biomphalaria glabrata]